jgi:hypothetical protein
MRNTSVAVRGEKKHLVFDSIRTQRPSVTEERADRCPISILNSGSVVADDWVRQDIHVFKLFGFTALKIE